jgi:hypothetical protein
VEINILPYLNSYSICKTIDDNHHLVHNETGTISEKVKDVNGCPRFKMSINKRIGTGRNGIHLYGPQLDLALTLEDLHLNQLEIINEAYVYWLDLDLPF